MSGTATAEAPSPWRLKTAANGITMTRIFATPLLILVVRMGYTFVGGATALDGAGF